MNRTHVFIATAVVAAAIAVNWVAFAQTPIPPAPPSTSSRAARIEAWTMQQWDAAKTKWASCQNQSSIQKLEGSDNWSFLYTCMTS